MLAVSNMSDNQEVENFLKSTAPPSTPIESWSDTNLELRQIVRWRRAHVALQLSGLLTVQQNQSHGIRIDWLQRLVLACATGRRKPTASDLSKAINGGLETAGVLRLEDPPEDMFFENIATSRGNFRIFIGQWESPGAYTQTLLNAFEKLPPGRPKTETLDSVYAILRVSEELALRSNLQDPRPTSHDPKGFMHVPNGNTMRRLVDRVSFSTRELTRLDISQDLLAPFTVDPDHYSDVFKRPPGESSLEFFPLISRPNGIAVISPVNISIAIRATLVTAAQRGGMSDQLMSLLLREQEEFSENTGFWPVPTIRLGKPNSHFVRSSICEFSPNRYLHVVQVPATFDGFPAFAFASVRELGDNAEKSVKDDIADFWNFLNGQKDVREGITVLLMSGWGTPHVVDTNLDHDDAPDCWAMASMSFIEASIIGACADGGLRDVLRLLEQIDRLEDDGFTLRNMSGLLNLFGVWRETRSNLIPEHELEVSPPSTLYLPTDSLLAPRIEAHRNRDCHAARLPDGSFKIVQRFGWGKWEDLAPTYASLKDVANRRLIGLVEVGERCWWVEAIVEKGRTTAWHFRVWDAIMQWLVAVGPEIVEQLPSSFPSLPVQITIILPEHKTSYPYKNPDNSEEGLAATILVAEESSGHAHVIQVSPAWVHFLSRAENDGEVELIAGIFEALSASNSFRVERERLRDLVLATVGSRDWRWLHARQIVTPVDRLASSNLVTGFSEIRTSAFSLVKCGSVWGSHSRDKGLEINGEAECKDFLISYSRQQLLKLIDEIRTFNRDSLVLLACENYLAARAEQSQWRNTIKAMRSIYGPDANSRAFERQNAINALQRSTKIICEIAACEAQSVGGNVPDKIDLDEMCARVLLSISNEQLLASILSKLIEPNLKISPAGDILGDRSISEKALKPGAEWSNMRALNEAERSYGKPIQKNDDVNSVEEALNIDPQLREAIEAEYSTSAESFFDLQYAIVQQAEAFGKSAYVIKRSELQMFLDQNENYPSVNLSGFLERLTLRKRLNWHEMSGAQKESDFDINRFDRPYSIINRPLVAMDSNDDPLVLVAPIFISDSTMYSLAGLMNGTLHGEYWTSAEARRYAGGQANLKGHEFEDKVTNAVAMHTSKAIPRVKLSWLLNEKTPDELGEVDVVAVSCDKTRVWIIEAKNLSMCRSESEAAARVSEYLGRKTLNRKGKMVPDKMLRHITRVQYLRERRDKLVARLMLPDIPEVHGLLVVDSPQPMNFLAHKSLSDSESTHLDIIDKFEF